MDTRFVVYISDTIAGSSDRRTYKTLARAKARFDEVRRTMRRNGHNCVVLSVGGSIICSG